MRSSASPSTRYASRAALLDRLSPAAPFLFRAEAARPSPASISRRAAPVRHLGKAANLGASASLCKRVLLAFTASHGLASNGHTSPRWPTPQKEGGANAVAAVVLDVDKYGEAIAGRMAKTSAKTSTRNELDSTPVTEVQRLLRSTLGDAAPTQAPRCGAIAAGKTGRRIELVLSPAGYAPYACLVSMERVNVQPCDLGTHCCSWVARGTKVTTPPR